MYELLIIYYYYINSLITKMSTNKKRGLELLAHKNRQQILYYISLAKIEIYTHCIIAYDPKYFINLKSEISYNCLSDLDQQIIAQKKTQNFYQHQQRVQTIEIQNKYSQKDSTQLKNKLKINQFEIPSSTYHNSMLTVQSSLQKLQKVIFFNNPDIAFYVDEARKVVQIHNLAKNSLQLYFKIQESDKLIIIQEIFRKKLCELGFDKKYNKIKVLGKGATAEVYLVERKSDMKKFAAKIISIKDTEQKQFQIFVNQAKLLRILRHKNIIHLQSVYIHKRQLIQVLQYLPGGTLLQCLKKPNSMRTYQKWKALRDICSGLQYLRKRRIVHRDLKLQNIMVRQQSHTNEYVISDFGLACWDGQKTPIYQKCGTPGYIAPEVLNLPLDMNLLDHRCDIFSLGVIAHLMFLLEPLFHYKGSVRDLINENKIAKIDLNKKKYRTLKTQQLQFLVMTLEKDIENRTNSQQLLRFLSNLVRQQQPKKSQRNPRRMSLEQEANKVQVKVKRQTSLTKKSIKMDIKNIDKNQYKKEQIVGQGSARKSSFMESARRTVSSFWESITNTSLNKKQQYKVKQNSVQKSRKMKDFIKQ